MTPSLYVNSFVSSEEANIAPLVFSVSFFEVQEYSFVAFVGASYVPAQYNDLASSSLTQLISIVPSEITAS